MNAYIEQDCTIEHDGRKFTSGGSMVSDTIALGYIKANCGEHVGAHVDITNWHGEKIGAGRITAKWRINSYVSGFMYQVTARVTVDGTTREFTGRTCGDGMLWSGKRTAEDKRS